MKKILQSFFLLLVPYALVAQNTGINTDNWVSNPGIIGTIILISLVLIVAIVIFIGRMSGLVSSIQRKRSNKRHDSFREEIIGMEGDEIDEILRERKEALGYKLSGDELGSEKEAEDKKGLIQRLMSDPNNPFFEKKKRTDIQLETSKELKRIIYWYMGAAIFWLVLGTGIGEYLGMKFVWPDLDTIPWLSFGRLRPVHTNTVFWGWSSLAMISLAYFVIARTCNRKIYSYKVAWIGFALLNLTVILGNISLMAGINNGGGEYREYIWPIMGLFVAGLLLTFYNFYMTIAKRKISEIYISNWFLIAALLWTATLTIIAYIPFYQDGLGETVVQGYYMHQGVGMWFMTFTLGLVYYYLPSSLNKPIYSYSLGILAFWTQLLFYTMIGTHHFIFSPLPWWLQTVAIVFSVGMFIPVIAGTTNFLMTMKGSWSQIGNSYILPFFLVGTVFYFVGSGQGSFQAMRFTNFVWHFTDFNVGHSHMTMYGIIAFFIWGCAYTLLPKITGKEPPQILVGAHFWLAFIGLFAYMFSMMVGGTLKGISWIEGNPFIQSVILMKEFYVWRAVGGSLMFISHIIFAYNFYDMISNRIKSKPKEKEESRESMEPVSAE